ncbi:GNAT family N-acetyltransferase [Legionella sp. CNM-1927-20]|uniref:GNAT family N-acetyltransferase n=1 Tax=Legionella sp. CNM-1927-20 TaxID=3422221 RepID=UPI00403B2B35
MNIHLETPRLFLRDWCSSDTDIMAEISSSPKVMEFFPRLSTYDDTLQLINKIKNHFKKYSFGLYAVERKDTNELIGFVGLNEVGFSIPCLSKIKNPVIEIGWRLSDKHWGNGFAPEAASIVLKAAFETYNLDLVVSFTAKINKNSIRVMEKIGLTHDPKDDFLHPKLCDDSILKPHVLYKIVK